MLTIQMSFQVPNIDEWDFEYPCPICRLETTVTLGQVRREEYFICRGCHSTIKIIDQLGDVQHLKQSIEGIFR